MFPTPSLGRSALHLAMHFHAHLGIAQVQGSTLELGLWDCAMHNKIWPNYALRSPRAQSCHFDHWDYAICNLSLSLPRMNYTLCSLKPQVSSLATETMQCAVPQPVSPPYSWKLCNISHQFTSLLLDLAFKVDLQKLIYYFHEGLSPPTYIIIVEHFSPAITITMAPKRSSSKYTTGSSTGEAVESIPVNLLVNSSTQLYVEKESYLTWKKVNEVF